MTFEKKVATSVTFISIVVLLITGLLVIWFGISVSTKVMLTILLFIFCGILYNMIDCGKLNKLFG